jgi:DNA-binding IclR family transcriptional regulator
VHRIVQALERQGLLTRPAGSKRYVLGDYCRQMAAAFADRADLRRVCEPILRGVSEETGNSAFLIGRVGFETICLARVIGSYPVQAVSRYLPHCQWRNRTNASARTPNAWAATVR